MQHFKTATERFKNFPVEIALLNRFTSSKEKKRILKEVKEGKIDLLIGTHRILSKDVQFSDLASSWRGREASWSKLPLKAHW